jgi:hypothetical protein
MDLGYLSTHSAKCEIANALSEHFKRTEKPNLLVSGGSRRLRIGDRWMWWSYNDLAGRTGSGVTVKE